jgi:hypothetical protein
MPVKDGGYAEEKVRLVSDMRKDKRGEKEGGQRLEGFFLGTQQKRQPGTVRYSTEFWYKGTYARDRSRSTCGKFRLLITSSPRESIYYGKTRHPRIVHALLRSDTNKP